MAKASNQRELDYSLKLLFKSSVFIFVIAIFSKIFSYLYRIIIARYFGAEIYGLFSLATMIFLWIAVFFSLGLYEGIVRFISFYRGKKDINKVRFIFRASLIIMIFSSLIAATLLFLTSEIISINIFNEPGLTIFLRILSFAIPLHIIAYVFLSTIQAFERIKAHAIISDSLINLVKLSSVLLLIFIGIGTNAVVFSYVIGVLGIFIASYIYTRYRISELFGDYNLKKQVKKQIKKELYTFSWPMVFFSFIYGIFYYVDSFVIGYFRDASQVGFYNAATPLAELMIFTPALFLRLFFPLVTKEFSKNRLDIVSEISKQTEKWIFIINLPLFFLLVLFPEFFINILFGPEYITSKITIFGIEMVESGLSLRILAFGALFYSMSMVFLNLISMLGKSKLILMNTIGVFIVNLILNIIFVPKFGIVGAAIATMIGNIGLSLIFFFQVKHYTAIIPLKRKMIRIIISVIIPVILLIFIKTFISINVITIFLLSLFFIISYTLLIFLTKSLDRNDIMILKTIKNPSAKVRSIFRNQKFLGHSNFQI